MVDSTHIFHQKSPSEFVQQQINLVCLIQHTHTASKVPILLFTGSYDGEVTKWERLQLNPFMYR